MNLLRLAFYVQLGVMAVSLLCAVISWGIGRDMAAILWAGLGMGSLLLCMPLLMVDLVLFMSAGPFMFNDQEYYEEPPMGELPPDEGDEWKHA